MKEIRKISNNNLLYKGGYILLLLFVFFVFYGNTLENSGSKISHLLWYLYIPFFFILYFLFLFLNRKPYYGNLGKCYILWSFWISCLNLWHYSLEGIAINYNTFLYSVLPTLTFIFVYSGLYYNFLSKKFIIFSYFLFSIFVAFFYFYYWTIANVDYIKKDLYLGQGTSYYLLLALPVCLLTRNRLMKILIISINILVVLSSMKRGGIIALGAGFFLYYFVNLFFAKKGRLLGLFFLITLSLSSYYFFYVISDYTNGYLVTRFENMSKERGSGRADIYEHIFKSIENQELEFSLFGHGGKSAAQLSGVGGAHNDFLEIFYDYGFFSLLILLLIHSQIFIFTLKALIRNNEYSLPMFLSFIIFEVLSFISMMVIYTYYLLLLPLWIIVINELNNKK